MSNKAKVIAYESDDFHVIEFPNGFHLGLDASYLDQVGDIRVRIELLGPDGETETVLTHDTSEEE